MSERTQYWGLAAAWTILIYSTLYIVRPICDFLKQHTPFDAIVWGFFVFISAWIIYFVFFHVRLRGASSYGLFFGTVVCYSAALVWLKIPEERIHLIQYGILACLVVRALKLDFPPLAAYAGAFFLTSLLGLGDEGIQHILPNRYFEWKDVILNSVSAGLGLLLGLSFQKKE